MEALLFAMVFILVGFVVEMPLVIGLGLVLLLVSGLKHAAKNSSEAVPAAKPTHKLIQAPDSAWAEQDWTPFLASGGIGPGGMGKQGMFGMKGAQGVDPLGMALQKIEPTQYGVLRNMLPFADYGRRNMVENFFFGLPISIGNYLFPKDAGLPGAGNVEKERKKEAKRMAKAAKEAIKEVVKEEMKK